MAANYFTCTLGQAAALHSTPSKPCSTVPGFIHHQAENIPNKPAVGFAQVGASQDDDWTYTVYSFKNVQCASSAVAKLLLDRHGDALQAENTIGLICPSTPDFIFTWLALMRLGCAVVLLAPQCTPTATAHLCKTCGVNLLLFDEAYREQAESTACVVEQDVEYYLSTKVLPFEDHNLQTLLKDDISLDALLEVSKDGAATAYLHHTSGTSSGLPKPIPQSHRAAVGVLPSFTEGQHAATFTTTPLYHGGIADLFRAWTSGALIWLFPGKSIPITAGNIVKCLNVARSCSEQNGLPTVKYFSSVPYVLQIMEADSAALKHLQTMDIVGVGGAALPAEVGDRLVAKGVNLISRFGSAECGFLMSSHRDYKTDNEWQYLRSAPGSEQLHFEKQDGGLGELVVLPRWPHMAKTNREDGSYATADLFAAHPSLPNAWKYHSRADSQLTLITGKKFDPAPLEAALATSELLEDVLIFGDGQPLPGALLFRRVTSREMPDAELVGSIWPFVQMLNEESQGHARLSRNMLIPMAVPEKPLEKSSKGTVMRKAAESRFAAEISAAYLELQNGATDRFVPDDEVTGAVRSMVQSVLQKQVEISVDDNLFSFGVDSVAGIQIRYQLRRLLQPDAGTLPMNIVEDCGSIRKLALYMVQRRHGQVISDAEDDQELMMDFVRKYSNFHVKEADFRDAHVTGELESGAEDVVVLTGATGALGAHVLDQYRKKDSVRKIYCLVRGADTQAAHERVSKALEQRRHEALVFPHGGGDSKVVVLQTQLGDERLGLEDATYELLASEATVIMHVAWSVNFRMKLRSFENDSIASVTNLINLALHSPRQKPPVFGFCSSVASVMNFSGDEVPEQIVNDPAAATQLGYSQSKWVAEQICSRAASSTRLSHRIAIFRVGQLSGDSEYGVWNAKEAWPMMLSAVKMTKTLPALQHEVLDWLPVDIAATALIEGVANCSAWTDGMSVLHVVNGHREPTWMNLLFWLHKLHPFNTVTPQQWLRDLELAEESGVDHPALKLLDHWKHSFRDSCLDTTDEGSATANKRTQKTFAMVRAKEAASVLHGVHPVDEAYFVKVWGWINTNM